MSTRRKIALLTIVIAGLVAVASPTAWADRLLVTGAALDHQASPQGYGGYITWFVIDPTGADPMGGRNFLYHDGQVRELRLSDATGPYGPNGVYGFDLGPDADGRPVAAFASCEPRRRRCAIRSHDLATDQERTIATVRAPCGSIHNVSIWGTTVAFVRTEPRSPRARKRTCNWNESTGSPNSALIMIRLRPGSKPTVVKRYSTRGRRYNDHEVGTVELSGRYVTWFSGYGSGNYVNGYLARVRNRRTLRACTTGGGQNYRADQLSGVTRPALVGDYIVFGSMTSDRIIGLFRQRGCETQSRERSNEVGQLLDANTFVYVKPAPETGYLQLFLSEQLPSFAPVPWSAPRLSLSRESGSATGPLFYLRPWTRATRSSVCSCGSA